MYKCPGCGAGLKFDPKAQALTCGHCGRSVPPADFGTLQYIMQASEETNSMPDDGSDDYETIVYTCPNCGASVMSTEETAVTFCSYCGESVVLEGRLEKVKKPNRIIPFRVSKEDCTALYKKMVRSAIFAPSHMQQDSEIDKFRGIYMPYWLYSYTQQGTLSLKGKTTKRRGDYVYTDTYQVNREVDMGYDGISYDAASQFSDNLSTAISPFNEKESMAFHPAYMSGFYADVTDVDSDVYEKDAKEAALDFVSGELSRDSAYYKYGVETGKIRSGVSLKKQPEEVGMFPVWFLSSRNSKGDRVSYAVVNGQTGRIAADLPISYGKYLLGSLLLAIPIFLVLNMSLTLTPTNCVVIAMLISLVGLLILNKQLNRTYTMEHQLDDRGLLFRRKKEKEKTQANVKPEPDVKPKKKVPTLLWLIPLIFVGLKFFEWLDQRDFMYTFIMVGGMIALAAMVVTAGNVKKNAAAAAGGAKTAPMAEKMRTLFKPVIGIILGLIVIILKPVADVYYYGAAVITMLFTAWSVYDIVKQHNLQTSRKLPQFEKRGGDGHA